MTTALATTHAGTGVNAGEYGLVPVDTQDAQIVAMWLDTGKRAGSAATQDAYGRTWRAFAAAIDKPLQNVTLDDLVSWQKSIAGSPATKRVKTATIRSLFAFAQKVGYLRVNAAVMLATPPTQETTHRRVLTMGQTERLVDACRTPRESALVRCLYSSGARVSELLSLRWQDVTPRENGAVLHIVRGKGGKSRKAGVNAATYAALLRLREKSTPSTAFVFATRSGSALDRIAAHRLLKTVAERAGLTQEVSCHWLRHSHATHALQLGENVSSVQQQLGHASLSTTTIYAGATSYSSDKLPV